MVWLEVGRPPPGAPVGRSLRHLDMASRNAGDEPTAGETSNPTPCPGVGSGKFVTPLLRIQREKASPSDATVPEPVALLVEAAAAEMVVALLPAAVEADSVAVLLVPAAAGAWEADPQPASTAPTRSAAAAVHARGGRRWRSEQGLADTLGSLSIRFRLWHRVLRGAWFPRGFPSVDWLRHLVAA